MSNELVLDQDAKLALKVLLIYARKKLFNIIYKIIKPEINKSLLKI